MTVPGSIWRSVLPRLLAACATLAGVALPVLVAALLSGDRGADFQLTTPGQAHQRVAEGFVGSALCATCHAEAAAAWHGSDHARAMAAATLESVLGDFSGVSVSDRDRSATLLRDGDRFVVQTDGPGGVVADFIVTETFADPQ
jgi:hypothetical protein